MEADKQQQQQTGQQPKMQPTILHHPPLPPGASLIEKIALPFVFSLIVSVIKNPQHATELREYMLAIRDAINLAYPDSE